MITLITIEDGISTTLHSFSASRKVSGMSASDLIVPTVPISYVLLMLDLVEERGISKEVLLADLDISPETLQRPDSRISLLNEYATLCQRALDMTGEPGLAYEFGLRSTLTTHGILGYGLMSQATLGDVFRFADRFGSILRMPAWSFRFFTEGPYAFMECRESISHGSLRRFSCEQLLVCVSSMMRQLIPKHDETELFFDYPEPAYHARYRERLPNTTFSTAYTRVRVPVSYLDAPLRSADAVSAQLAERECERELSLLSHNRDIVNQVRTLLVNSPDGYPAIDTVANGLFMSTRTLSRQLSTCGSSFRELMTEAQKRDCQTLLRDSRLTLTDIAYRLGYSSQANFARAFRAWHGKSPSELR